MDDVLRQQLAYYRARAREYDESVRQAGCSAGPNIPDLDQEWAYLIHALHSLSPCEQVLELACGTGIWTQELLRVGASITALDGAPEMLDINRAKLASPQVQYQQVDLFDWAPNRTYDLVFFAFWLSHVPPAWLDKFLSRVAAAVRPGGRLFIVDEPATGSHLSGPTEAGNYQTRILQNGRAFRIVKAYYNPMALETQLSQFGFSQLESWAGDYFFYLTGIKAGS